MHVLLVELKQRWDSMFDGLAAGRDLPPGHRLRAEGIMEAVVLIGAAAPDEVVDLMGQCYTRAFGRSLEEDFGAGWQTLYPFPQIPAVMARAPVFPSTSD